MAIKLYRSNYDEFDPTKNGGDITDTQIESGVLHSFIPHIRPFMAENGGERWFKFFVKTNISILSVGIDIAKPTLSSTEDVYLALGGKSEFESDLDKENIRLFGGFEVLEIDSTNRQVTADRNVSEFVKADDFVTFYDENLNRVVMMEVERVEEDTIAFKEWGDKEIKPGYTASSTLFLPELNANDYAGIWLKQTIAPFTKAMEDPADEFSLNIWYDIK